LKSAQDIGVFSQKATVELWTHISSVHLLLSSQLTGATLQAPVLILQN